MFCCTKWRSDSEMELTQSTVNLPHPTEEGQTRCGHHGGCLRWGAEGGWRCALGMGECLLPRYPAKVLWARVETVAVEEAAVVAVHLRAHGKPAPISQLLRTFSRNALQRFAQKWTKQAACSPAPP